MSSEIPDLRHQPPPRGSRTGSALRLDGAGWDRPKLTVRGGKPPLPGLRPETPPDLALHPSALGWFERDLVLWSLGDLAPARPQLVRAGRTLAGGGAAAGSGSGRRSTVRIALGRGAHSAPLRAAARPLPPPGSPWCPQAGTRALPTDGKRRGIMPGHRQVSRSGAGSWCDHAWPRDTRWAGAEGRGEGD